MRQPAHTPRFGPRFRGSPYPLVLAILTACTPVATAPEPTREVDVFADVPLVQPAPQTVETQRQGGVSITVAPTHFDTVGGTACSYQFPQAGLANLLVTPPSGATTQTHQRFVEVQYHDINASPSDLVFLVTIRNGMSRVFRGAGAVVQFSVDSHIQAVEQSNYLEFLNVLIPPNNEAQVKISGPALTSLKDGATFGVFLYDVVTAIDNAGTVTKRDNFEWFFRVTRQHIALKSSLVATHVWVPRADVPRIAEYLPGGGQRLINQDHCLRSALAETQRGTPVAHPVGASQPAPVAQTGTPPAESHASAPPRPAPRIDYKTALDSGTAAVVAGRTPDAIRFFETARRENPYHRDALLNLTRLYLADSSYVRAIATGRELIAIDACDPEGYKLVSTAYGSLGRQLRARAQNGGGVRDSLKWTTDSATKYDRRRATLPAALSFSVFSPTSTHVDLTATVTNKATTARAFTVFLSFLDARGTTVAADTVRTGSLAVKATKEIKSSRSAQGVAAFSCRVS